MLVVLDPQASEREVAGVVESISELGGEARAIRGGRRKALAIVSDDRLDPGRIGALSGVRDVVVRAGPYHLVSRQWQFENTVIEIPHGPAIGGADVVAVAGPCAVESAPQIVGIARRAKAAGAAMLRGGAFKPRTSPYSFQGIGLDGLRFLAEAREETGLPVVTEAMDPEGVDAVERYADMIQIGSRNMQNFSLLKRVGEAAKPVLLKRGVAATISEWLQSAEYILAGGNPDIVLCERGIRHFDPATRNMLDLTAVPAVKQLSHLPVIVDPSHGTGRRAYVTPMALAAIAAGADGIMVEIHDDPDAAWSDGAQSLYLEQFEELVRRTRAIARAMGRDIVASPSTASES